MECATGVTNGDAMFQINRMNADSLVDSPNSGLSGSVTLSEGGRKLTLNLTSRPSLIADGYSGAGTIEAELRTSGFKP